MFSNINVVENNIVEKTLNEARAGINKRKSLIFKLLERLPGFNDFKTIFYNVLFSVLTLMTKMKKK